MLIAPEEKDQRFTALSPESHGKLGAAVDRLVVGLSVCLLNVGGVSGPFEGLSVCVCVCLSVCLSVCLRNVGGVGGPFEGLSVCVSVCLCVCLSVCLSVFVSQKCGWCGWTV